ncbi:MAG: hypothetical protein IT306_09175 [Chloroflexi bacterium]|nr:hypothetical protein [Chloroflexota bacterium]
MNPDHVAAHVRERSGLDVQAVTLARAGSGDDLLPTVWAAMTELGHFWAVEDGERIELFRAVARRTAANDLTACHSAVEAARRFLSLHPPGRRGAVRRSPATAVAPQPVAHDTPAASLDGEQAPADSGAPACQTCGAAAPRTSQARSATVRASNGRLLCSRCRHAERERLRYQQDPTYRARRLAYSAARYRRNQQPASPE